jgi:Homeodomain-like domain
MPAHWSVFQGSFDPGAGRSWLLGSLRRSAFRHHPPKADLGPITPQSSTVVALHARESWMARRKLTVDRHEEIKRRLADGRSLREIATALGCSRRLVRQIRDGERLTHETAASPDPLWMSQLEWPVIIHELGLGHPMKFIWEERAKALISTRTSGNSFIASSRSTARRPSPPASSSPRSGLKSIMPAIRSSGTRSRPARSTRPTCSSQGSALVNCCLPGRSFGAGWEHFRSAFSIPRQLLHACSRIPSPSHLSFERLWEGVAAGSWKRGCLSRHAT